MLKAIHAQEDRKAADAKSKEIVARLKAMKFARAAELVEQKAAETLTYFAYPSAHWRQIRTNNPLERIIREVRRRTRVVGAFPDGKSALMLVAARLRWPRPRRQGHCHGRARTAGHRRHRRADGQQRFDFGISEFTDGLNLRTCG